MKQRLLLALLVLFAAVGMVKAESSNTLTIPANSRAVTLTFTKASNSSITVKVGEKPLTESGGKYTINSTTNDQTVTITEDGISALTVNGPVSKVSLSISSLKTLKLQENGGYLTKGKSSETLSLNGCSLTTLEVNNCGLDYLPTSGFSTTEDVTVYAKSNKITDLSSINIEGRTKKLTYELDGNQITTLSSNGNKNVTFNYETQVIKHTFTDGKEAIANKWFNVQTTLINLESNGIPALKNKEISTISWLYNNNIVSLTKGDNPMDYKFYNGSTFLDGAFQCKITPKDTKLPTYIVHMQVAPAKFKFSHSITPQTGDTKNENTLTINKLDKSDNTYKSYTPDQALKKTDKLQLSPKAASGYTFKEYKLVGIKETGTTGIYDVVGNKDKDEVSLEAIFEQKKYTVTIDALAHGRYEIIDGENNKIMGTSLSLPYDTKLYIKATPDAGYEALVAQDGSVISAITDESHKGEYLCTVKGNTKISIRFELKTEDPKLIIPANPSIQSVKINGKSYSETQTRTSSTLQAQSISLKKGATVYVEVTPAEGHNIAQIILDGKVISTNSSKANFTMPETDASLTFKVVDATTIGFQISGDANTYTYDGTEKKFNFTTVPAGITGFTVKYSPENIENYTTTLPVAAGTYKVSLYRAEDALYSKVNVKYNTDDNQNYKVIIKQATPTITTLPSVTVDANTQAYKISGGSAQAYGKTIPGKFRVVVKREASEGAKAAVTEPTYEEVSLCTEAKNHIALVQFVPTDDANHTTAIAQVPVQRGATAAKKYKISWKNIPSDMTFTVKNGDSELKSGTEVAVGTKLFVQVEFPAGYSDVKVVEDNAEYTFVAGGENSNGTSTSPAKNENYEVTKQVTFIVQYEGKAAEAKTPKVKITAPSSDPITYNGSVQTVQIGEEGNDKYKLEWVEPSSSPTPAPTLTITYKDAEGKAVVSPVNAGKYTVCVHIPAFSVTTETPSSPASALQLRADGKKITTYYKETNIEFKDAFIIEKADITIPAEEDNNDWPTAAYVGVGQTLSQAKMIGGVAPIAGRFAFVDGDKSPENGIKYPIKFIPTDNTNYNELVSSQTATVTVSDKRIIAFDNIVNGTVTVKDKATGKEYKAGDELPSTVKELVITATPNTGYKLESLTVDGSSISNGSTYTLGSKSITINATFYASYKVTVTKPSKGAVVTLPSSSEVKKGESYSFTVACLAADKSKIVVKDGSTVITGTDGKYTISNITADKAIFITLDNPTAITVAADTTLSPHKKPMGTITITGATDGKCYYGETVTVKATPVSGVQFAGWVGRTETTATLSIKATEPSYKFKAKYTGSPTGIETIEGLRVYGSQGYVFVGCDTEATVTLIHMNGRVKKVQISGDTRIEAQAGIYGVVVEKGSERMQTKVIVR